MTPLEQLLVLMFIAVVLLILILARLVDMAADRVTVEIHMARRIVTRELEETSAHVQLLERTFCSTPELITQIRDLTRTPTEDEIELQRSHNFELGLNPLQRERRRIQAEREQQIIDALGKSK